MAHRSRVAVINERKLTGTSAASAGASLALRFMFAPWLPEFDSAVCPRVMRGGC